MHIVNSLDAKTIFGAIAVIFAAVLLIKGMNTPPRGQGDGKNGTNGNNSNNNSNSNNQSTTTPPAQPTNYNQNNQNGQQ